MVPTSSQASSQSFSLFQGLFHHVTWWARTYAKMFPNMTQTNIDYWEKIVKNPTEKYAQLFKQEREYLQRSIGKGESVLDIGCGDGRNILSVVGITTNIIGLDIDEKAVKDALQNLKDFPSVKIVRGSAFELPFEDHSFDNVLLSMTFVNFAENKQRALLEMTRVVTESGKIIVSVYSEKALEHRLAMYKQIQVPIREVSEKGVIFDESVGAHISEQFSFDQINELAMSVGLNIVDHEEVPNLAHIFTLVSSEK